MCASLGRMVLLHVPFPFSQAVESHAAPVAIWHKGRHAIQLHGARTELAALLDMCNSEITC